MRARLRVRWGWVVVATAGCTGGSIAAPRGGDAEAGSEATAPLVDAASDVDGGACRPGDVSGFEPPSSVPPAAVSLACNGYGGDGGLVQSYANACLGYSATYATCAGFAAPDAGGAAACYACLTTPESPDASSYGVVVAASMPVVNYAACIEAVDPTSAGRSCALALYVAASCADYACKAACPVVDQASLDAYTTCINTALYGACTGYTFESACLATEKGDGGTPVASVCFAGPSTVSHYLSIAQLLCGGS
jgi:hypothetical protein